MALAPSFRIRIAVIVTFFTIVGALSASAQTAPAFTSRVIIVSVDGLRSDALNELGLPLSEASATIHAQTDPDYTLTLPNHTSMLTGRFVSGLDGHGWYRNDEPSSNETLHAFRGWYVPSIFDVVHDEGGRTGLFAGKTKFSLFDVSYNAENGRPDAYGVDYGRDKIDVFSIQSSAQESVDAFKAAGPFDLAFLHFSEPDDVGHEHGWTAGADSLSDYHAALEAVDSALQSLLDFVQSDPAYAGVTNMIVTADHGGTGTGHSDPGVALHFEVPFVVWGPAIERPDDLYALNIDTRGFSPAAHVAASASPQPLRNAEAGNLALQLMDLPPVPGSMHNADHDLAFQQPPPAEPTSFVIAFQDGVSPSADYAGTSDTKIKSDDPATNFGAEVDLEVDHQPAYATLIRWDLSGMPAGAQAVGARMVFGVSNPTTHGYQIRPMSRSWNEAEATWNEPSTGDSWEIPGAEGELDRESTRLGLIESADTGSRIVEWSASQLSVLQQWMDDPTTNHGIIIQRYNQGDDGMDLASSEHPDASLRPRLEISYVLTTAVEPAAAPVAAFTMDHERGEGSSSVILDASGADSLGGSIARYFWDFGDNSGATGSVVDHIYDTPGVYEVTLTVFNDDRMTDRTTRIVIVDEAEEAQASFQQGVFPLPSYVGAIDTKLQSDDAEANFGDDESLFVDGSPFYSTVMRWDLTAIAPGIEVVAAQMTVDVVNPTSDSYEIHPVLRPWDEGNATWTMATSGAPWATAGAEFSVDALDAASVAAGLGESMGTLTGGVNGPASVVFTEAGRQWLARWINEPASNHGFVIQNFADAQDGLDFRSSEALEPALRPRLDLTYRMAHHVNLPERVEFETWPNPFRSDLSVRVASDLRHGVDLELYDMLGRRVLKQSIASGQFGEVRLDTSFLAAGVYALILTEHGTRVSTTRLVAKQ